MSRHAMPESLPALVKLICLLVTVCLTTLNSVWAADEYIKDFAQLREQHVSMIGRIIKDPLRARLMAEDKLKAIRSTHGKKTLAEVELLMMLGHTADKSWDKRKFYTRALKIVSREVGKEHPFYGQLALEAATNMVDSFGERFAAPFLNDARRAFSKSGEEFAAELAATDLYQGKMLLKMRKESQAETYLLKALQHDESLEINDTNINETALLLIISLFMSQRENEFASPFVVKLAELRREETEIKPVLIYSVKPEYPHKAQAHKIEGVVRLGFEIDDQGFVKNPVVLDDGGYKPFGEEMLEVIKNWRYAPRTKDGKTVSSKIETNYTFKIQ